MTESEDIDFNDYLSNVNDNKEVNPINIQDVMSWIIDQNQDTRIQITKFAFNLSGLMSNKEASILNNRSASAECQYGEKEILGHNKYAKFKK